MQHLQSSPALVEGRAAAGPAPVHTPGTILNGDPYILPMLFLLSSGLLLIHLENPRLDQAEAPAAFAAGRDGDTGEDRGAKLMRGLRAASWSAGSRHQNVTVLHTRSEKVSNSLT